MIVPRVPRKTSQFRWIRHVLHNDLARRVDVKCARIRVFLVVVVDPSCIVVEAVVSNVPDASANDFAQSAVGHGTAFTICPPLTAGKNLVPVYSGRGWDADALRGVQNIRHFEGRRRWDELYRRRRRVDGDLLHREDATLSPGPDAPLSVDADV